MVSRNRLYNILILSLVSTHGAYNSHGGLRYVKRSLSCCHIKRRILPLVWHRRFRFLFLIFFFLFFFFSFFLFKKNKPWMLFQWNLHRVNFNVSSRIGIHIENSQSVIQLQRVGKIPINFIHGFWFFWKVSAIPSFGWQRIRPLGTFLHDTAQLLSLVYSWSLKLLCGFKGLIF